MRDGNRPRKPEDSAPDRYRGRIDRLNKRLADPAVEECLEGDTRRLTNHLRKYAEHLFTFLDYDHVPFENNFAERQIRPAVILRKNGQSNRSDQGAATQAVLMSVYRTLSLRGLAPTMTTSQLPRYPPDSLHLAVELQDFYANDAAHTRASQCADGRRAGAGPTIVDSVYMGGEAE